jgi:hypothetical protein
MDQRSLGSDVETKCAGSHFRKNGRRLALLLALVFVLLATFVHPAFVVAAAALWVGLIILGGGTCPLCPPPDSSDR